MTLKSGSSWLKLLVQVLVVLLFCLSPMAASADGKSPVLVKWTGSWGYGGSCEFVVFAVTGTTLTVNAAQTNYVSHIEMRGVRHNACTGQDVLEVITETIHWLRDAQGVPRVAKDYTDSCYTYPDGTKECTRYHFKVTPAGTIEITGAEPL